jgi:hypothetical protein
LKSFLLGRQIRVVHNSLQSDWFSTTAGVPQGAVLSPFLFLIYINDIVDCATQNQCEIALFADDIAVWPNVTNVPGEECLQACLKDMTPWANDWLVTFGQKKSQAVCFTRLRNKPIPQTKLLLADFQLEYVDNYRYLGVILQADLTWELQTSDVIRRANYVSTVISNVIFPNKPPGIRTIVRLVEALLLPLLSYGMPMWSPHEKYANQLDQLIARPLRRCLSLPQASTHALSTIVECGTLSINSQHALSALRFGSVLHKAKPNDPCLPFFHTKSNFIAAKMRRFEKAVEVKCANAAAMASVRSAIDDWQLDAWRFSDSGSSLLKGCKLQSGTSLYLLRESRRLTAVRARLRLERSSLNSSLFQRRITADPSCPECKANDETVQHCLLECPRYEMHRQNCRNGLSVLNLPLDLPTLLGDNEQIQPAARRTQALSTTGKFLAKIDEIRKL